MEQKRDVRELEKSFKDIIENDLLKENIKIIDVQYAGQLKDDMNDDRGDNDIFIVEVIKTEKDFSGGEVKRTFKKYYQGTKCIGADIGDNEPILSEEIKNKEEIKKAIKNNEKNFQELEKNQIADVVSVYVGRKIEIDEIEKQLKNIDDKKDKNKQNELSEKEKKKIQDIRYIQKIRMDKKINPEESLGQRLEMEGYTELYVINSRDLNDVIENEVDNSQYSLVAISANGDAEIVNNLFLIDKYPMKNMDKTFMNVEANGMVREDNKDDIQLRRKSNNALLGIDNKYEKTSVYLYEKDVKNEQTVGIELETTEVVKNQYVIDKEEGIYDVEKPEYTNENVDMDDYIPGTQITWSQFASKCGYRGEGAIERAVEEFRARKERNPEIDNTTLTNEIVEEKEEEYRGQDRGNHKKQLNDNV